jgi:hypothetical protein
MSGEPEVKQQVGGRSSSRPQSGRPQLADMDGRPFLDGAVPLPDFRQAPSAPARHQRVAATYLAFII